jgi:hypothetical protein
MSWSVTEIAALAAKAARGAGAPPAQAARFGQAAARHLAVCRDSRSLTQALEALPSGPIMLLPVVLDAAVAQAWDGSGQVVSLPAGMADDLVESYLAVLPFEASLQRSDSGRVSVRLEVACPLGGGICGRIKAEDAFIEDLARLAARTFVPETDASRSRGAGAGLDDND